jgi:phosphonate transport system permease protein
MAEVAATTAGRRWRKPPLIKNANLRWGLYIGAVVYFILASYSILVDVNWLRVYEGLPRGAKFVGGFFPPFPFANIIETGGFEELAAQRLIDISDGLIESLTMTVTSTVIGIIISVPIGLGAARNIAPMPVYLICRGIIAVSRSFQEVIIAIFFVAMFGFGPFAGMLTLSFATIGFLSKLLAEDIESMDPGQAEAIRATGSRWPQWVNYGVQPQVMPRLIGLSLYRLDINFRESSVVGIVGAGGIGSTLLTAFDRYEYSTAATRILLRQNPREVAVMPVRMEAEVKVWQRRDRKKQLLIWGGWFAGVLLFVYCWQIISGNTTWFFVWDSPRIAADIASRMVPPRWEYIYRIWDPLWDTINIATLGTVLALCMAVPVAFLAARNTTPSAYFVRPIALFIIVSSRSINSLIWALLLVSIIGPGVFAGTIAIALRSIGFCAKLLYEAIEEIDHTQVEAIEATGASRWQIMAYGIVPQIMPAFAGISVFRWDINIRESTVLGLVGAGGIGLQLSSSLNILAWPQVTLILIAILVTVLVSEWVSAKVRHAII